MTLDHVEVMLKYIVFMRYWPELGSWQAKEILFGLFSAESIGRRVLHRKKGRNLTYFHHPNFTLNPLDFAF
jgi:hypothetical protein